jgi:hypothetical protein
MMNAIPAKIRTQMLRAKLRLRAIVRPTMVASQPKLA